MINKIKNNIAQDELIILVKYECTNENEFRSLIKCLIIGLLIVCKKSDILLGINKYVYNLLDNFMKKLSNRRKIDSEFYIELIFIERYLEKNDIKILEFGEKEYGKLKEKKKKTREFLKIRKLYRK